VYNNLVCFCGELNISLNIVDFVDKMYSDNEKESAKYEVLYEVLEEQFNDIINIKKKEEENLQRKLQEMRNRK
jgi:hypothetical protein